MRKTCVRLATPVLATLTMIIAVAFQWSDGALSAQSSDPLTLPRLKFADLTYVGGFRLPRAGTGDTFSYGGSVMAYNPARNSLFVNSYAGKVAEVTIPTPVSTNDVTGMPFASYLQSFFDPTEGHFHELATSEAVLAGLVVHGDRLYGTGSVYYDAMNRQVLSHFSHSTSLAEPSFIGMSQVWETGKTGYVAGYLANIPGEWQSLLGGSALTGQCCIPIVSRTSFGPAAFAWNPPSIGRNTAITATPLLYYTQSNATLGPWEGANERYGATAKMGGVAVIAGTRTALFIGRNGLGTFCYGTGTADASLAGTLAADGEKYCYDPTYSAKSQHAYPYRYQIWAYDLADFAAVKNGTKQPWDVEPYEVWPFDLPTPEATVSIGGVAYDAQRQVVYIAQYLADPDGYASRPVIHALKINVPSSTAPPPPSTMVSAVADVASPQKPGASITWTAAAVGSKAPYEYKWYASSGGVTTLLQDWSTSPTLIWQPTVAATDWRVSVWTRSAGNVVNAPEATGEYPFPITDIAADATLMVNGSSGALSVSAGTPLTIAIANGPGGVYDWVTIVPTGSPDTAYTGIWFLNGTSIPPAAGRTSATFAIPAPATAGTYEVRFLANGRYQRLATRGAITVGSEPSSPPPSTAALTVNGSSGAVSVAAGSPLTIAAANGPGNVYDWVTIAPAGSGDTVYTGIWFLNGTSIPPASGVTSATFAIPAPATAGTYEVRFLANGKYQRLATSGVLTVGGAPPPSSPSGAILTVNGSSGAGAVSADSSLTIAVTNGPGSRYDWVTIVPTGSADTAYTGIWFLNGTSIPPGSGLTSATFMIPAPSAPGTYEVRLLANGKYQRLATSGVITVGAATPPPGSGAASVTVNGSSAALAVTGGSALTISIANGPGSIYDWVTIVPVGSADTAYTGIWFLNGTSTPPSTGLTSTTITIPAPSTAGTYEVRFLASGRYVRLATSGAVAVTTGGTVSSVSLTGSLASPQPLSSTVVWTASVTGGTGALVYKWFISNDGGGSWTDMGPYASSNQFTWTPTAVNANYRIAVWVKRAENTSGDPEAEAKTAAFAITGTQ